MHRARAALAFGAALLGAGEPEVVAQPVHQRLAGGPCCAALHTIHRRRDRVAGFGQHCRRRSGFSSARRQRQPRRLTGPAVGFGAGSQRRDCSVHHDADGVRAVLGAAADVVDRRCRPTGSSRDVGAGLGQLPAGGQLGCFRHGDDGGRDAAEGDHEISHPAAVELDDHGGMHHRDGLCPPQAELHERAAPAMGPVRAVESIERDCGDDLVGLEHGLAKAGEELADRNRALATHRGHGDCGVKRHERRDGVVGRAGGDDVADHGGPVAQRRRAHLQARLGERQAGRAHRRRGNDVGVGHQRRERDPPAFVGDPVETRQAGDVHQQLHARARSPRELEYEVGAAGDQARRSAVRREQLCRLVKRAGGHIPAWQRD